MKVWSYVLKDLRILKKDLLSNIIIFIIFPITISLFYGYFENNVFNEQTKIGKFSINIVDNDNSRSSEFLSDIFSDKSLKNTIEIKKSSDADIQIVIPAGFQKNADMLKNTDITIRKLKKDKSLELHVLQGFLNSFASNYSLSSEINKTIYSSSLSTNDKNKAASELLKSLTDLSQKSFVKTDKTFSQNKLNSFEYYAISMLTFVSILMIIIFSNDYIREKDIGTIKRMNSIPIKKSSLFIGRTGSVFIKAFISIFICTLFYRITGKAYRENYLLLLLIILINVFFIVSIFAFVTSFFKDYKKASIVLYGYMVFSLTFGGTFFPIDNASGALNVISYFSPNKWLLDMYQEAAIYNDFSSTLSKSLVLIIISFAAFALAGIKTKFEREV